VVETFKPDDEVVITPTPENLGKAFELFAEMPTDLTIDGSGTDEPPSRDSF